MKIRLGVVFGGPSVEHEVSIISALQAINNIDENKYEVIPIYITKDREFYTSKLLKNIDVYKDIDLVKRYAKKITFYKKNEVLILQTIGMFKRTVGEVDIIFPIVHGNNVEGGSLTGYFETLGVPVIGCNVLGAALGQDKVVLKQVLEASGLPIVPYTWFYDKEYNKNKTLIFRNIKKMGYPVIVKPASLGSSVGISFVKDEVDLNNAIIDALKYDNKIIIEKAIINLKEVNCSIVGNYEYQNASVIEEVVTNNKFLTYSDKYLKGSKGKGTPSKGMGSQARIIPANINNDLAKKIQELSKLTFSALNLSGVCRIDFLIDTSDNKVYINEPNTIPGSLSYYLWEKSGKNYPELLSELISIGIKNYKHKESKVCSFETNILSNFKNGSKGSKGKI